MFENIENWWMSFDKVEQLFVILAVVGMVTFIYINVRVDILISELRNELREEMKRWR